MTTLATELENYPQEAQKKPISETDASPELLDEGQWVDQICQQECIQNPEIKLKSRVEEFITTATPAERREIDQARDQLWNLMQAAKTKDDAKNPDYTSVKMPTSQRFKKCYNSCVESAYDFSKHMDVFVGQAPEYVALAWGAVKILLVAQISNMELKESVHSHLKILVRKFNLVDHLPDLIPQQNLIEAVAEAYALFSKFLAKAIKYYSECRAKRLLKAFTSPWKIRFQELVEEIDTSFQYINDITHARSHIVGETNLTMTRQIQAVDKKMWNVIRNLPEQIQKLEDKLHQVNFEKTTDISQTTSIVQQRLEERFFDLSTSPMRAGAQDEQTLLEGDILDIFTDLQELETNLRLNRGEAEYVSETREQKTKRHNILRSDEIIAWVESETSQLLWVDGNYILSRTNFLASFATPLTIDAACNYESLTVLKHFCSDSALFRDPYCILVQSLLMQLLKQHPRILGEGGTKVSQSTLAQAKHDFTKLWDIFTKCLLDKANVGTDRTYIIIDSIDMLSSVQAGEYDVLMSRLNGLILNENHHIKILLTARILAENVVSSDISNALSSPQNKWSLAPIREDLSMFRYKFCEIQEGRCETISFIQLILLYPPRTLIFAKHDQESRAYIVSEISGMAETMPGRFDPLHLRVWSIDHNGVYFTKRYIDITINQFSGNKAVEDLRYVPAGYLPNELLIRKALLERGRRYWKLASKPNYCCGPERDNSRYMIDQERRPLPEIPAQEFDDQLPRTKEDGLKPLVYILSPPIISVYSLARLKWKEASVSELLEVRASPLPDNVHWISKHRNNVMANIKAYIQYGSSSEDFVSGKRRGLIMLFYGPEESDKYIAIEDIAEKFGLPLLVIDTGCFSQKDDMGTQLQRYLELGSRWTALVHFKRAEVLVQTDVETRGLGSLQSAFLNALDSYEGIAIISTDTVGRISKEFISIICLAIEFLPLTTEQKLDIWELLLEKIPHPYGYVYGVVNDDRMLDIPMLNSRRGIMNVFNSAVALASAGNRVLEHDHIDQIIEQAIDFAASMKLTESSRLSAGSKELPDEESSHKGS